MSRLPYTDQPLTPRAAYSGGSWPPLGNSDRQKATSLPVSAKGLNHSVVIDGHAAEDHVLALQHREALPLEEAPG